MKNKFSLTTVVSLLLISALFNVIIFLCYPDDLFYTTAFWLVWAFTFPVNIIFASGIAFYCGAKNKDAAVRVPPVAPIAGIFTPIYLVVGGIMMLIEFDSITFPLILELVITVAYIVILMVMLTGVGYIEKNQAYTKQKVTYIRLLEADVKSVYAYVANDDTKKKLEKLAEKIRFSDPMSHPSLADCESQIEKTVAYIVATLRVDGGADVSKNITDVEALIDYRNDRCKILK